MLKAGLTGGLACGKSFVAREMERLGGYVIHADALGHEVLLPEGEAYRPVVALFGTKILDEEKKIDRRALAGVVFETPEKLERLNAIVHPAVHRLQEETIARIRKNEPNVVVVVEAAILIEAGLWKEFDSIILVVCRPDQQMERALARTPSATRAEVTARMDRQFPAAEKRRYAEFVIDTSGTVEETFRQTREVYEILRRRACQNVESKL